MKIEYLKYSDSLIKDIEKNPEIIYVFSDYALKNFQRISSKRNIFDLEPLYLTIDEFRGKIFQTEKIILSEAKRFVSFYNVMKDEFEKININSYFESIEFANKFFTYYTEKNRALCKDEIRLEEWQNRYFEIFDKFKEKYQNYLEEKKYIPKDWIEDIENFSIEKISKYKKIIFIDIVSFTELDKVVIKKLAENFEVEIRIQIEEGDFDEENLELKKLTLTDDELNIFSLEVENEYELAGNLIDIVSRKFNVNVYSPESDKNEYFKLFPNNFMRDNFYTINDSNLFKFLDAHSDVIKNIEYNLNRNIPIEKFIEFITKAEVREYYSIKEEDIGFIYNLIDNDFKYVGLEENEKIRAAYENILRISEIKEIDDFIKYFNRLLSLDFFREYEYKNLYEKLQEYMGYAKTTEIMLEKEELKKCFKNGGEILKFLLQYFNNVEVIKNEDTVGKILIKAIDKCKVITNTKESIFINVSTKYTPKVKRDALNLTEKQKKENGFTYYDKERLIEKYRLYQAIFKNQNNTLIYVKNKDTGEGVSSLLSELLEKYTIRKLSKRIKENDILSLVLDKDKEIKVRLDKTDEVGILKEKIDFEESKLNLGAYDIDLMSACEYRFYLQKIAKLNSIEVEVTAGVSAKFLGTYTHYIYEKLTDKMWKTIVFKGDYSIDESEVEELLLKSFEYNRKKIPLYLDNYFVEILIPRLKKGILKFYKLLEEKYQDKKVIRIESEKKSSDAEPFINGDISVNLNGRVDLVVETNETREVIDFKTGSKGKGQLDIYTIMLYGDETKAEKAIYNAFDGEYEAQKKTMITKEELKELIINFLQKDEYNISDKKTSCQYCNYEELCRRED